jgi:hypothetical protein
MQQRKPSILTVFHGCWRDVENKIFAGHGRSRDRRLEPIRPLTESHYEGLNRAFDWPTTTQYSKRRRAVDQNAINVLALWITRAFAIRDKLDLSDQD